MSIVTQLLAEIDEFLLEASVAESTFGRHAVNDGKFVGRLRAGAGIEVGTVERVRSYMAAQREARAA